MTRFSIELEAITSHDRPADVRLRGLLKIALRAFGLKCVTVRELRPPETGPASSLPNDREAK